MKVKNLVIGLSFLISASIFATDIYTPSFVWNSPEIMAQGGSFVANAQGFNALLTNPAAFDKSRVKKDGSKKGEFTLLSVGAGFTGDVFAYLEDRKDNPDKTVVESILDQVTTQGIGTAMQVGTGYVGRGFGFGLMSIVDADFPKAETTLGATGNLNWTTGLVAGYALPINIGSVKLVIGADVRPMYRMSALNIDMNTVSSSINSNSSSDSGIDFSEVEVMGGFGVGFDMGTDLIWKDLTLSMTMRDIGHTKFHYKVVDSFAGTQFKQGYTIDDDYIVPWTMNLGAAYAPTLGSVGKFFRPSVHASYAIPFVEDGEILGYDEQSSWSRLDVGAQVELLSFLALRAGYNGGYFTGGFGLDLLFVELNGALYSQEMGEYAGTQKQMGGSLELAFRF